MFDKMIHRDEFRLRVLLTNACNQNCAFCLNDFQDKEPKQFADMMDVMDCLGAYSSFMRRIGKKSIVTFSGGEPGIHPGLGSILRSAKANCDVVKVVTNGTALRDDLNDFVDCWHVSIPRKDPLIADLVKNCGYNIVPQRVVTDEVPKKDLIEWADYYIYHGMTPKFFTDFYSDNQQDLRTKIAYVAAIFDNKIMARFTGTQENRGKACEGCKKKCITLKALWYFPDGSSSTCPQGVKDKYDDDTWDETVEKAYEAHRVP